MWHCFTPFPRGVALLLLMMVGIAAWPCIVVGQHTTQQANNVNALPKRWSDNGYGISLRLPHDTRVIPLATEPDIARFITPDGMELTLMLDLVDRPAGIDKMAERAVRDASLRYSPATVVKDNPGPLTLAGRDARRFFLLVGESQDRQVLFGQMLAMYDRATILALQVVVPAQNVLQRIREFEQIAESLQIVDSDEQARRRTEQLKAGEQWLKRTGPQTFAPLLDRVVWQRIAVLDQEHGYRRFGLQQDQELGLPGIRLRVQTRTKGEDVTRDTFAEFFLSDDQLNEVWSIRTTERPVKQPPANRITLPNRKNKDAEPPAQPRTWADTGLRTTEIVRNPRTGDPIRDPVTKEPIIAPHIKVSRETPLYLSGGEQTFSHKGDVKNRTWQVPPAYLSQLHKFLLPYLLEPDSPPMAFYTYHPPAFNIALLTVETQPTGDGGYVALVRQTPRHPQEMYEYDADGRLVRQIRWTGEVIEPATAEQIQARWQNGDKQP